MIDHRRSSIGIIPFVDIMRYIIDENQNLTEK